MTPKCTQGGRLIVPMEDTKCPKRVQSAGPVVAVLERKVDLAGMYAPLPAIAELDADLGDLEPFTVAQANPRNRGPAPPCYPIASRPRGDNGRPGACALAGALIGRRQRAGTKRLHLLVNRIVRHSGIRCGGIATLRALLPFICRIASRW